MESVEELVSQMFRSVPEPHRAAVEAVVRDQLLLDGELHKAVQGGADPHAYLWSDLLAWEDAVAVVVGLLTGSPQAAGITGLLQVFAKHRSLRVKLTRSQADVLRAVKRGNLTLDAIIEATRSTAADGKAQSVVQQLLDIRDHHGRLVLEKRPADSTYHTIY
jgi:hypothetical protein